MSDVWCCKVPALIATQTLTDFAPGGILTRMETHHLGPAPVGKAPLAFSAEGLVWSCKLLLALQY